MAKIAKKLELDRLAELAKKLELDRLAELAKKAKELELKQLAKELEPIRLIKATKKAKELELKQMVKIDKQAKKLELDRLTKEKKQIELKKQENLNQTNIYLSKYNSIEKHIGMLLYNTEHVQSLNKIDRYELLDNMIEIFKTRDYDDFIKEFNRIFKN